MTKIQQLTTGAWRRAQTQLLKQGNQNPNFLKWCITPTPEVIDATRKQAMVSQGANINPKRLKWQIAPETGIKNVGRERALGSQWGWKMPWA